MNVTQAAIRLGVKKSAVRKAIARGLLPATLVRNGQAKYDHYDIEADALDAYRLAHPRRTTQEAP